MARPAGMQQRDPTGTRYGVVLALSPTSDPSFRTQMRVALGSSTGTFTQLPDVAGMTGPGQYPTFVDVLPNDGTYRVYQSRAARDGYGSTQAWGHTVKVKPALIPEGVTQSMPITGHRVGSNLSLSTGIKLQYGSANVPSSAVKTVTFGANIFLPQTSTVTYSQNGGNLEPGGLLGTSSPQWAACYSLPPGTSLRKVSVKYVRASALNLFEYKLFKFSTAGVGTLIVKFTNPTTASAASPRTVSSSSFAAVLLPDGNSLLVATLAMKASVAINDCSIQQQILFYTVPSYDKTI